MDFKKMKQFTCHGFLFNINIRHLNFLFSSNFLKELYIVEVWLVQWLSLKGQETEYNCTMS